MEKKTVVIEVEMYSTKTLISPKDIDVIIIDRDTKIIDINGETQKVYSNIEFDEVIEKAKNNNNIIK